MRKKQIIYAHKSPHYLTRFADDDNISAQRGIWMSGGEHAFVKNTALLRFAFVKQHGAAEDFYRPAERFPVCIKKK
jgi:hypothetical protein